MKYERSNCCNPKPSWCSLKSSWFKFIPINSNKYQLKHVLPGARVNFSLRLADRAKWSS